MEVLVLSDTTFGARLRKLRKEKNLHQKQLAEIFKISPSAIGSYERNLREPTFELLELFALYFDCSLEYLLGLSNERLSVEDYLKARPIELDKLINDHTVTINGIVLTNEEKNKLIDVSTGLFWEKFKK